MYRARVGDVIEFHGYIGIITYVGNDPLPRNDRTVKLDWIAGVHPDCDFRLSHPDADWYPVSSCEEEFKLICNVRTGAGDAAAEG